MVKTIFNALLITILIFSLLIVDVGCLWVLRVAIDWWLDIDYVERIKQWMKK